MSESSESGLMGVMRRLNSGEDIHVPTPADYERVEIMQPAPNEGDDE